MDLARRHRIVVVDDCVDMTELLSLLLTIQGHECVVAHSEADARVALRAHQPDLVFLDLSLPDGDGCELARAVRERSGRQPYLVALTGWGGAADRRRTRDAGFDRHVVKPMELSTIDEILDHVAALHAA
jgi:DNA-binding response OmpR family regulator